MADEINQCLNQLQSDLETALVSATADKVYGFRVLPDKLVKSISLTYIGGLPKSETVGGAGGYYDFAAVLVAQHDNSESGLEAAEQALNAMEKIIHDTVAPSRNGLWRKAEFVRPSTRPPTPQDLIGSRYGEVYFRLHLK